MIEKAWAIQIIDALGEKQLLFWNCFADFSWWEDDFEIPAVSIRFFATKKIAIAKLKNSIWSQEHSAKVVRVQVEVKVI